MDYIELFARMRYNKNMKQENRVKYYRHKIDNLLVVSRIVTVHYLDFKRGFASEGEAHDFWEMVYVERGELTCTAGEKSHTMGEGEVLFHRPGEYHRHTASGREGCAFSILSFECRSEGMRFFEERRTRLPRDCVRHLSAILSEAGATFDVPVDPLTKKMELLPAPALGGTQMIKNRLEMLLILLLRYEMSRGGEGERFLRDRTPGGLLADRIIERMKAHLYESLSVGALCEGIAYSRSYIFKEFRKETGRTIADYYHRMKITEAKRLLREGAYNVSEISELLSFESPNYFSKTFKRYTGITPRAYRAKYREE